MASLRLLSALALLVLAMAVVPVFAVAYGSSEPSIQAPPILGTTGAPALSSPKLFGGAINTLYANGRPVVLQSLQVNLKLCSSSSCVTVPTTLTQTGPGTYTYSISPPSLTGIVTIYIIAGSLTDTYGRIFPSVDTQIGTYAAPSTTSLAGASQNLDSRLVSNVESANPELTREAVPLTQPTQESPILQVLLALTVLTLTGFGLLLFPSRH